MASVTCCDEIIGGEVYITATFSAGGTRTYEAMGEVRIQPSSIERTAGASSNGKVWVVEASRPVRALFSFVNRCNPNPLEMYCHRCLLDIVVYEKSRGFYHKLDNAMVVGAPEINLSTGEITGIEIVTDEYSVHAFTPEFECTMIPASFGPPIPGGITA